MMDVQAEHVSLEGRVDAAAEHSLTWLGRTGNTACCRRRRWPAAISVGETRSGSIKQLNKARGCMSTIHFDNLQLPCFT